MYFSRNVPSFCCVIFCGLLWHLQVHEYIFLGFNSSYNSVHIICSKLVDCRQKNWCRQVKIIKIGEKCRCCQVVMLQIVEKDNLLVTCQNYQTFSVEWDSSPRSLDFKTSGTPNLRVMPQATRPSRTLVRMTLLDLVLSNCSKLHQ